MEVTMKLKDKVFKVHPLLLFLLAAAPIFAQTAYLRTTTDANRWADAKSIEGENWQSTGNYVEISPETKYQTVLGWGGTIQEKHWEAMKVLSDAGKDSIMRALFDTSGCNINFLRLPIGCCDFDLNENPISLNETANDYEMKYFSLKRDSTRKIPLIKMAQAINPNIRFWGCPWSPPRWMHDNGKFDSGNMKSDAQTLTAYALYLEKFVLGYKDAGINVEWVCCQNEPNINDGGYPKCGWSNALELNFYKNYMIPRFKQSNLSTRIILGVFCCGEYKDWITYFMNDQTVRDFVGVTSHSYQAPDWGLKSYNDYPNIPFFQTEAPFGWPPESIAQNWKEGCDIFNNVSDFMNNRTAVYHVWNMVNDERGMSGFDWVQMVMIQVNRNTKKVSYNPYFWAYKHFAHYVKAGAKAVQARANGAGPSKMNAFVNPNGDVILVCANYNSSTFNLTAKVGNKMWKAQLPPNSFNTLKIAIGTSATVPERKTEEPAVSHTPASLRNIRVTNSSLHFTLPVTMSPAEEISVVVSDLQGRIVWTGRRKGSAVIGERQSFDIRPSKGSLLPGNYLLTVAVKNRDGTVKVVENVVAVTN